MRKFFIGATAELIADTIPFTPVDTGNLRGKIADSNSSVQIDPSPIPLWATLRPQSNYTSYVEFDTRPHWPPRRALEGWAHRPNIPVFLVMRNIARFGTKGARMFEQVFAKFGVKTLYFDMCRPENWGQIRAHQPALVWLESPTNPLLKILDIASIDKLGAPVVVDNTFGRKMGNR